jgi:hypothetical protein
MTVEVRKIAVYVEETQHDGGPMLATPVRKGWAAAVVKNPYAGRYVEDIMPMMEALKPLGIDLSRRLTEALGGQAAVDAYGKGVIVGSAGEIEHSALWHVPGGYAMREILGRAHAIVPSACKMGAIGTSLDLPIHHKDACYVRSHFDAIALAVPDAPRADELVLAITMACGGRPHARAGGLKTSEIAKMDGQR